MTTILTLYGGCRYILERNEFFKEQFLLHIIWQIFYFIVTLITIYTANRLINEVCSFIVTTKFVKVKHVLLIFYAIQ